MGASMADSGVPFLSTIEGEYQLNLEMAKATEADARFNATQRRKEAKQLMGEQIAVIGMSGVEIEGTPMEIIQTDMADAEQEAMNIIYSGKMNANQVRRKAAFARTSAYTNLAKDGLMMAAGMGAFSGGGGGAAASGGFDARSTGTRGFTMSETSSTRGFSSEAIA